MTRGYPNALAAKMNLVLVPVLVVTYSLSTFWFIKDILLAHRYIFWSNATIWLIVSIFSLVNLGIRLDRLFADK